MSRKNRKQNWCDSSVQGALLRRVFCHWLIFFVVASLSVVMLQTLLGDPAVPLKERLMNEAGEFVFMAIVLLSLFPAFMLDTIRFSNRFVGPVGRLRRYMNQLGRDGNTEHCNFRDNDFWSEAAAEFNTVADRVAAQQAEIESLKEQLNHQTVG